MNAAKSQSKDACVKRIIYTPPTSSHVWDSLFFLFNWPCLQCAFYFSAHLILVSIYRSIFTNTGVWCVYFPFLPSSTKLILGNGIFILGLSPVIFPVHEGVTSVTRYNESKLDTEYGLATFFSRPRYSFRGLLHAFTV